MKDWRDVHRKLARLAGERAAYDAEEAYWIREGERAQVWREAGCASYAEYLGRLLGIGRRSARERIRVALALGALPAMSDALSEGAISWTMARELSRVATGQTERDWLAAVEGQSVRQVEEMVAGLAAGDRPGSVRDRSNERRVLRFAVSNDCYAAFRAASEQLMRQTGHSLSDDELIGLAARAVLAGGSSGDGRSSYQLAYHRCPDCAKTRGELAGMEVEVDAATAEMIDCDATVLPMAEVGRVDREHGAATDDESGGDGRGATAVTAAHVGRADPDDAQPRRASQTVTPAMRRQVLRRYRGACAVPGCGNGAFLDIHHLERRADGGGSEVDDLVPLCWPHHHGHHAGSINIERRGGSIEVTHADGTRYGSVRRMDSVRAKVRADALAALVHLGFKEREARAAVRRVPVGSLEQVIRSALEALRPRALGSAPAAERGRATQRKISG